MLGGLALSLALVVGACGGSSSSSDKDQTIAISLTNAGCDPASISAKAGPATFKVTNKNAAALSNDGAKLLRRGYSFTDGVDPVTNQLDGGLFFIAYQRDPRKQFIPIQRKLAATDALNEYIKHVGSAIFACPPGAAQGQSIVDSLFA